MNSPFLSLKHKNFRLFLFGMLISNIGTWMQNIAQPWLAYQLTNDALKIGLVSALQFAPTLFLSLFAGAVIERTDKKKMLFVTQTILMFAAMTFAVLVFTGLIQYWHVLVLATTMGIANAFDRPIRQSFVFDLVPKEYLMNAIALNSTGFNLARMIGPAFAGIILGIYGVGACFLINSLSFLSVIISVLFIKPLTEHVISEKLRLNFTYFKLIFSDVGEGLKYLFKSKDLFLIVISSLIISCFSMNHSVVMPVFVTEVLHLAESDFGFVMTSMGLGSFLGALLLAASSLKGPRRFNLTVGPMFVGLSLIAIGVFHNYPATLVLYVLIGFLFVSFSATVNTSLQLRVDNAYRARILSVYILVSGGTMPIGNLFTGFIVRNFGASAGLIINGSIVAVFMLIFSIIMLTKKTEENT